MCHRRIFSIAYFFPFVYCFSQNFRKKIQQKRTVSSLVLKNCSFLFGEWIIPDGKSKIKIEKTDLKSGKVACYFFAKDLQSVHWSIAGSASWVPMLTQSREQ